MPDARETKTATDDRDNARPLGKSIGAGPGTGDRILESTTATSDSSVYLSSAEVRAIAEKIDRYVIDRPVPTDGDLGRVTGRTQQRARRATALRWAAAVVVVLGIGVASLRLDSEQVIGTAGPNEGPGEPPAPGVTAEPAPSDPIPTQLQWHSLSERERGQLVVAAYEPPAESGRGSLVVDPNSCCPGVRATDPDGDSYVVGANDSLEVIGGSGSMLYAVGTAASTRETGRPGQPVAYVSRDEGRSFERVILPVDLEAAEDQLRAQHPGLRGVWFPNQSSARVGNTTGVALDFELMPTMDPRLSSDESGPDREAWRELLPRLGEDEFPNSTAQGVEIFDSNGEALRFHSWAELGIDVPKGLTWILRSTGDAGFSDVTPPGLEETGIGETSVAASTAGFVIVSSQRGSGVRTILQTMSSPDGLEWTTAPGMQSDEGLAVTDARGLGENVVARVPVPGAERLYLIHPDMTWSLLGEGSLTAGGVVLGGNGGPLVWSTGGNTWHSTPFPGEPVAEGREVDYDSPFVSPLIAGNRLFVGRHHRLNDSEDWTYEWWVADLPDS